MLKHNTQLSALILEAVRAPQGLKAGQIGEWNPVQVGQRACRMVELGSVFRAKISTKDVRFFDTAERARAYEAANARTIERRKKQVLQQNRYAKNMEARRSIETREADFKASNQSVYTVTAADEAKITRIPTPPNLGNRCYVDPDSVPSMFRAIPLGSMAV